jgi:hypothetical protein
MNWRGTGLERLRPNRGIYSFGHQWLYSPLLGPGLFFSFMIFFTQKVGLLGRVISPSQGLYLNTGQHKHGINAHTDFHALSGIRTHDPSVPASEGCSCLRPRGQRDRLLRYYSRIFLEALRKTTKNFSRDSRVSRLRFLPGTPKYKSRAVPSQQAVL